MTAVERLPLMTVEEYLDAELESEVRHEYVGGYLHAMAGGKVVHARVGSNFVISIGTQLRGKRCEVMNSGAKVRVRLKTHTRFYCPDAMVVCEPNEPDDTFQDRPVLIAEVLSETTRRTDQTEKRDAYLSIPSLAAYLLIETDEPRVLLYRRVGDGEGLEAFEAEHYTRIEDVALLPEVEAELPLAELYERVTFASE